ncbi:hypothetical protein GWI33_014912 [Rhynchophorus ferrugineus]|uniref:Uncharacterized protein n=1 Tax=Rhynchophorus ferrugineus TaxID=354439 RepID=A0A834I480_RHYFE|nr:hypothetical protein GWI33_014912 [Rhynchophorus ferrugineus]
MPPKKNVRCNPIYPMTPYQFARAIILIWGDSRHSSPDPYPTSEMTQKSCRPRCFGNFVLTHRKRQKRPFRFELNLWSRWRGSGDASPKANQNGSGDGLFASRSRLANASVDISSIADGESLTFSGELGPGKVSKLLERDWTGSI